jgi:hypothetical protein
MVLKATQEILEVDFLAPTAEPAEPLPENVLTLRK